jgi:hypothetical protein
MTDIPEDIMRAAESVFLTKISPEACGQTGGIFLMGRIAHVLMAERERCAQVVASVYPKQFEHEDVAIDVLNFAASAIRSPERAGE